MSYLEIHFERKFLEKEFQQWRTHIVMKINSRNLCEILEKLTFLF